MLMPNLKRKVKNTSVSVISKTDDGEKILRSNTSIDPSVMHSAPSSESGVVGFALGMTKNMGNYESLRIDAWATASLSDYNGDVDKAYNDLRDFVTDVVRETAQEYDE